MTLPVNQPTKSTAALFHIASAQIKSKEGLMELSKLKGDAEALQCPQLCDKCLSDEK